jgi:hypothetical protein
MGASVDHTEARNAPALGTTQSSDNIALIRELDGVARQVEEHLPRGLPASPTRASGTSGCTW